MRRLDSIIHSLMSLACLSTLPGCSFIGLSDFELPECTSDLECQEAFNEANGYPLECAAFICDESGDRAECINIAEQGEVFDAADNDCDGIIDEANNGNAVIVAQSELIASATATSAQLTISTIEDESHYYLSQDKDLELLILPDLKPTPLASYSQAELASPLNTELSEGCYVGTPPVRVQCTSQEFAVASGGDIQFYASVNTRVCPGGEVRVGVIDPRQPTQLIDRGDGFRNPAYRGVNPTPFRCTIAATEACENAINAFTAESTSSTQTGIIQNCGARRPSIAAFGDQALVTYVADRFTRSACSNTVTEVQGLAIYAGQGFEGSFYWANPSNDGRVEAFGKTKGDAAPANISIDELGFFTAFGDENGEVSLQWLPAQTPPINKDEKVCPTVNGAPDCESRSGRETDPLAGLIALPSLPAQNADDVHLAWLGTDDTKGYLAVSWTQGCGSGELYTQVIEMDLSGDTPEVINSFEALKVGSTLGSSALLSAQESFFAEDATRNGEALANNQLGGFYVAYETNQGIVAKRIASADGQLVQADETISIANGDHTISGVSLRDSAVFARSASDEKISAWTLSPPSRN